MGSIAGGIRLEGPYKQPAPLKVNKNRDFCGSEVPNESLLVGPRDGLQNAVVIVHPVSQKASDGSTWGKELTSRALPKAREVSPWYGVYGVRDQAGKGQTRTVFLDNKRCAFVPRVQVAAVGSEILLLNSDLILHAAHARLGSKTLFNVGLPAWRRVKRRLDQEGIVKVECDVLHTWQTAYIVVTASPYFAVTGEAGEFAIEGVPPGTYRIEVWHERLGRGSKTVTVRPGAAARFDFAYRED